MKFFAFIMAFIVLAQSVMPCADAEVPPNAGKAKTEITKQSQQQSKNHMDDCSPFCSCACCAGIAFFDSISKVTNLVLPGLPKYNSMIVSPLFNVPLPIWQPPQIA